MPLAPSSFITPVGPVDASLFPGEGVNELTARLQAYLDNSYADPRVTASEATRRDGLARSYTLYQTFRDAHMLMVAKPMTVNVAEKGGHGYTVEQLRALERLRDKYLADFDAALILDTSAPPPPLLPPTQSVATDVRWD